MTCCDHSRGNTLFEFMDLFDLSNVIKEATFFMKMFKLSITLDVILTNPEKICMIK